jgi:hypothetical protein
VTGWSSVTPAALQAGLDGLRRRHPGKAAAGNYFRQTLDRVPNLRMIETEDSICFLHDEWDLSRLYVATHDPQDLRRLLTAATWSPIVATDWISRSENVDVEFALTEAGFHLHATYDRIVCQAFRRPSTNTHVRLAVSTDGDHIHWLLLQVFDKYADHIMAVDELRRLIAQQEVIVSRNDADQITGFVVFPISGRACNFNFLYNNGGVANLFHLLTNFYGTLAARGVESGFSWVRRTRPEVLKLHRSFGWNTDGLIDHIYLRA